jgi:hypothetical protein
VTPNPSEKVGLPTSTLTSFPVTSTKFLALISTFPTDVTTLEPVA